MSGSGQAEQSGFMKAMSDPSVQRYLVNMGTGMAGGKTLADSLAGGLQMAGQGLIQDMDKEQRKKLVKDVLGSTDLSSLDPMVIQQKGLELIGSGDPTLAAIGQHLVTTAVSKTPSAEWKPSEQVIGGKNVAGQVNARTGEFKPFSADIQYGPKLTYVPELQGFYDPYGIQGQPGGAPPSQQVPISGLTDASISQPTSQPNRNIPVVGGVGMTPKARQDLAIWGAQQQVQQGQEIAKEQRQPDIERQKLEVANKAKQLAEAETYLSPDNLAAQEASQRASNQIVSELKSQIGEAHKSTLPDIPAINKFRGETLGDPTMTNLAANVKNLVATKIGQMKAAGVVSAGQLNSDKDIDLQFGAIFDVNAPKETQMQQLKKLEESAMAADKQIELKRKKYENVLLGKSPAEPVSSQSDTTQSNPYAGKILTKGGVRYKVNPDGTVEQL